MAPLPWQGGRLLCRPRRSRSRAPSPRTHAVTHRHVGIPRACVRVRDRRLRRLWHGHDVPARRHVPRTRGRRAVRGRARGVAGPSTVLRRGQGYDRGRRCRRAKCQRRGRQLLPFLSRRLLMCSLSGCPGHSCTGACWGAARVAVWIWVVCSLRTLAVKMNYVRSYRR